MTRVLASSALLVAFVGLLPAAPVPREAGKPFYFPTRVGTKWVYEANIGEGHGEAVTESEEKDGRWLVTVKATSADFKDGDTTTVFRYAVSHTGVFMIAEGLEARDTRKDYDEPICLLKLPPTPGEEWRGDSKQDSAEFVVRKAETVKVPAGTFEAVRVDRGKDHTCWYAPGVGVIEERNGDFVNVMKSFSLPKE